MSKKLFTDEQINDLRNNPYTSFVSEKLIRFTPVFKDEFWKLYKKGESPSEIFRKLGYDPSVLGESRIYNFTSKLSKSRLEFSQLNLGQQNEELIQRISVLENQMDFLKKAIEMANSEKRRNS